jgi:hypothetical protein
MHFCKNYHKLVQEKKFTFYPAVFGINWTPFTPIAAAQNFKILHEFPVQNVFSD